MKIKIWKGLHRNISSILLLILSFYLVYKIYETQQRIKQRQFRGVFIEGMSKKEKEKKEEEKEKEEELGSFKNDMKEAVKECVSDCTASVEDEQKCNKACKPK